MLPNDILVKSISDQNCTVRINSNILLESLVKSEQFKVKIRIALQGAAYLKACQNVQ